MHCCCCLYFCLKLVWKCFSSSSSQTTAGRKMFFWFDAVALQRAPTFSHRCVQVHLHVWLMKWDQSVCWLWGRSMSWCHVSEVLWLSGLSCKHEIVGSNPSSVPPSPAGFVCWSMRSSSVHTLLCSLLYTGLDQCVSFLLSFEAATERQVLRQGQSLFKDENKTQLFSLISGEFCFKSLSSITRCCGLAG